MTFNNRVAIRICLLITVLCWIAGMSLMQGTFQVVAQDENTLNTTSEGTAEATAEIIAEIITAEAPVADSDTTNDADEDAEALLAESGMTPADGDNYCFVCHASSSQNFTLADGTSHSIAFDANAFSESVHGDNNPEGALGCTDCHEGVTFPHVGSLPETERAYTVSRSLSCTNCHVEQTENLADSVHYTALADGNLRAATCVDCHGAHEVSTPDVETNSLTCGECHTTTFSEYENSVHGEALLGGDMNAPACTDCHGVHAIQHPTTALFRNRSPELCATCHADVELMTQYDISTNVFNSYITDFHGTTVAIFNQTAPNTPTNKAVCYDCHGVHDITRADDSKSQVVRENLLETCRECHPGATSDFSDTWVGHFEPTLESHPFLFLVDLFYNLLIPGVLGAFALLIGTDIIRIIRNFFSRGGE